MTVLVKHFGRAEFACRCGCGFDTVDAELLSVLVKLRQYFNRPVKITSGARCPDHNRSVGGASNSQHIYGRAADIQVDGVDAASVAAYLEATYRTRFGIGRYPHWTHIDTRSGPPARWAAT